MSVLECARCGLKGRFKTAALARPSGSGAEESADDTEINVRKESRSTVGGKGVRTPAVPTPSAAVADEPLPLLDAPLRTGRSAAGELDDLSEDHWQKLPKKAVNCPKCAIRIFLAIEAGATTVPVVCPSCGAKGTYKVR